MNIRLGLIGAEDNLGLIKSIVDEYPEFNCLSFEHSGEEELVEHLEAHSHHVDVWLFSGFLPYSTAIKWGKTSQPMYHTPYTGSSLYKTLYHILNNEQIKADELSFDAVHSSELNTIFDELGMEYDPAFLEEFIDESDIENSQTYLEHYKKSVEKFVQHHYDLWNENHTKAAVTCVWAVYTELKRLGVPVFRVTPANSAIKSVLNIIVRTHEMVRFRNSQIAVQMLEIDPFSGLSEGVFSSDEISNIEMRNSQKLLNYAKKVQGSLKTSGPGRYVIFTTRGEIDAITERFTIVPELEETLRIGKQDVTCGIGIGNSAYDAEINAGRALLNAKEYGEGAWMVLFEDKTINGPLGSAEKISYSYASAELQGISEETSLSVSTLGKIKSILDKWGKSEMTAHELAQQMQIMPRSARRIIVALQTKGYVKVVGEENPFPRGRPRKIYRFSL
ncbi:ArsR family transcriptional regulator [Halobacillus salinus]|uniref:ArsR family transcriptional regulator n=1 Tax=Halobacillus salinus TaxID=192814 RepID=A0A4Z0GUB9_9BACI|nr:ArsR family transcriptional regulator [Halobacillus salinus]TGB01215.1 ArsR family transcriptional regulator [Halobacillus salinus]